ncbi:MAG: hypothetical protein ACL7BU_09290 [Candidatus Phlomobacter fragariae]
MEKISGERDEALRTKSQISRSREESALGKLRAATRKIGNSLNSWEKVLNMPASQE